MAIAKLIGQAAALGVAATLYAWWESTALELTEHRLVLPDLPPALEGLRILHVSDTHFPASGDSVGRFTERIWGLDVDLVCCTADYVETAAGWDAAADALSQLRAPLGVYATLGAHDYCEPVGSLGDWAAFNLDRLMGFPRRFIDPSPFVARLEAAGLVVLRNGWRDISVAGATLRIAGAGDASVGMARLDQALPSQRDADACTILLTHSPDAAILAPHRSEGGPSLVLSGHTHGGQIRIPGWGAPLRHSRLVSRRQASGVFDVGGAAVVVSRGFGTAHIPLRLACRPEISILTLSRQHS